MQKLNYLISTPSPPFPIFSRYNPYEDKLVATLVYKEEEEEEEEAGSLLPETKAIFAPFSMKVPHASIFFFLGKIGAKAVGSACENILPDQTHHVPSLAWY